MYSSAYVWAKVLNHMENRLTPAVVSTWFDDAEVVELNDEQLILYTASPFRKEIIQRRCTEYIKDAMKEIFNTEIDLVVFGPEELAEYKSKGKANTVMDFNPQFTFENFVVGPQTGLPAAPPLPWPTIPVKYITLCLSTDPPGSENTSALRHRQRAPAPAPGFQNRIYQRRSIYQ